jgi:hypothetical protein
VKQKSPSRLKSELYKKLRPEVDLPTLAHDIADFLDKPAGKSARGKDFANILAAYLAQKYSVTDRKSGELHLLIERHSDHLAAFLDEISFKETQAFVRTRAGPPQPTSLKELVQALLKTPDELPPSENKILPAENDPPRRKRKCRPRPKTETERSRRRNEAKREYERRRNEYRRGLIVNQFGTYPFPTLYPNERTPPEGACLDVLLSGGAVSNAAHAGSLEDLFGIDRHRFPKPRARERRGRNVVYGLAAFLECMIHLLANRDGKEQWLPEGPQRDLVLTGIIARARRYSPEGGHMVAEKLGPYVP